MKLGNRGQGAVFGWLSGLLALFIVVVLWIMFDDILQRLNSLWGTGSTLLATLLSMWYILPILFMLGWLLRSFVLSMTKELSEV